jgi:hypothetical protein
MKSFFKSLLLVLFSICLSLLLGEVFIRVAAPQRLDSNLDFYVPDEYTVFKMQSNFVGNHTGFEFDVPVQLNSIGMRDSEIGQKDGNTLRIMGLGDSFTFANGVALHETYLKQLEQLLPAYGGKKLQTLNAAVPAYAPLQEFRLWELRQAELQPNIVMMGFFVGNDFVESGDLFGEDGKPLIAVRDGRLISSKRSDEERGVVRSVTGPMRDFLKTRSHLYVFLRNRSSELLSKAGLRPFNLPPDFCEVNYGERMQKNWAKTQTILSDFGKATRANGQRLIIVILPAIYQVYNSAWDEYIRALKLDPTRYDLEKPQKVLMEFCKAEGIECVDALPALRAGATNAGLYFPVDGHPTAAGHKVIAEAIREYLLGNAAKPVALR